MTTTVRAIAASVLAALASAASAQLTLLAPGPQIGTHTGNLVTFGSFEGPGGNPGTSTVLWATGASGTVIVPPGWTSSGNTNSYARWGRDPGSPFRLAGSDIIPDGGNALYFGNGQGATTSLAPTFNANGEVTFAGTPAISTPLPNFPTPVKLWQTVPTHLTPAPSYILSFWVSGEGAGGGGAGMYDGIFGLKVTNTALGDPIRYFAVPSGGAAYGSSKRFEFSFTPLNPLAPVTVEFTNWGHFLLGMYGFGPTTELVLDDVIVNAVPAPGAFTALALAGCLTRRRRR